MFAAHIEVGVGLAIRDTPKPALVSGSGALQRQLKILLDRQTENEAGISGKNPLSSLIVENNPTTRFRALIAPAMIIYHCY